MGTRVFVGGLSARTRESDLERFFDGYGRIRDIVIKGRFGFVEFDDVRDAEDAVKDLDGKSLNGERLGVEFAKRPGGGGGGYNDRTPGFRRASPDRSRRPPPLRTEHRLIVENLSSSVSWQDLKDFMRKVGEVTFTDAHRDRRGEGVVEFRAREGVERALDELDDAEFRGKRIRLYKDEPRGRRSRSRSRSRGRRRSRSPSRSRSRSRGKGRSRSRSRSGSKRGSRPGSRNDGEKNGRRSSRDRSRSPAKEKSRSRSRSKSASPNA